MPHKGEGRVRRGRRYRRTRTTCLGILVAVSDASTAPEDMPAADGALAELRTNLELARDLVRGGRHLQRLQVRAFNITDLYRAAWVQAVSALDHWVHRELYERALWLALDTSAKRPAKFLQIQVPMAWFEDVHHGSTTLREAFREHLQTQFGHLSFQHPEKIKQALAHVSDASLWSAVAVELSKADVGYEPHTSKGVQDQLLAIVKRRNRIAHEADRNPDVAGRSPLSDAEAAEAIEWIERLVTAMFAVIGPPPPDPDEPAPPKSPTKPRWSRQDIETALDEHPDPATRDAVRALLTHADAHDVQFLGGIGTARSAGLYYWVKGKRKSLWSLYLSEERPSITVNFASVRAVDEQLARQMVGVARKSESLDAALLLPDDVLITKYPTVTLNVLGESPDAVQALIAALDTVILY